MSRFDQKFAADIQDMKNQDIDEDAGLNLFRTEKEEEQSANFNLRSAGEIKSIKKEAVQLDEERVASNQLEQYMKELDPTYDP